jgi:molybdopterin-containing oxidoreductase family iron-sulfur binding subunit
MNDMKHPHSLDDEDRDGGADGEHDADDAGGDAQLDGLPRGFAGVAELVRRAGSKAAWQTGAPGDARLDRISRRAFFRLAGASAAAAGLAACSSRPPREILPYAHQPPELSPGVPLHYATALVEDGFATGIVVASHEGRPTKIEGNPDHPASLGATRARDQAAVLALCDPERVRSISDRGVPAVWSAIEQLLATAARRGGRGLHLVLEPTSSPFVIELVQRVRAALPEAGITFWAAFSPRASLAGNRIAFGRLLQTQLDLQAADVIVTLDADLVADHPMALAYARRISDRRRVVDGQSPMSRLYAIEASYTATGVIADHRMRVRASEIERIAAELLAAVSEQGQGRQGQEGQQGQAMGRAPAQAAAAARRPGRGDRARWITEIARDLWRAAGRSVVAAGERQPPVVHAIAAAINAVLGNTGRTVGFSEPAVYQAGQPSQDLGQGLGQNLGELGGLQDLARAIDRGRVTSLIVLGGNPAYAAPADLALARMFARVANSLYLGLYQNETARACRFVVPALHDLEQWDVARAYDGTLTPLQPLIEPLFGGRSVADVLHQLLGDPPATAFDRARAAWSRHLPAADFAASLALGVVAGTALPPVAVDVAWDTLVPLIAAAGTTAPAELELELRPHPFVHDGRYTNNPWLLELPSPITKLTWDNAAEMSPHTAARLGVSDGDVIALTVGAHTIDVPAIVVPGHADDAIALHAGFGRDGGEQIARGIGANAFRLWTTATGLHPRVTATALGRHHELAITQVHGQLEHRPIALAGTLQALHDDAEFRDELARHRGPTPSLMPAFPMPGAQWAMSIDLTTCTGCSACVMACAAENNTPVVGRRAVLNKREMHWLRIDRYFDRSLGGTPDDPSMVVQPMTCQHCERAPCEYVCPVEATTHSPDGLNEMTYNRCIGTRFCSNNCPYKVRRFNWFDWKEDRGLRVVARNPDVTVRDRGVMEKCTYCVQRIRRGEIDARIADRPLGPDEVRTACQQACPAQAIAFGSITDPASTVTEHRRRPHSYAVLHDQGTAPRTRYLARIRNPNGALG